MRIWANTKGVQKEAYLLHGSRFKCFPPSTNHVASAKEFATVEGAALFLLQNPGWGIRMNPGSAIIYDGINIALD
ncbi:hypothetical protein GCM10011390_48520 [Aureimonas endophytica]|uniref:Uncharacterized protein n=1 Tax=Aureimonas endophytica TaxID=2027858 RepID=A0A917A3M2_9HYPH|nr:hypothetical protein GCM10011390_48520 [Aureimonas endophytica]